MADLWSEYTDGLLRDIDKKLAGKYKMTIRDMLENFPKYAAQPNIKMTLGNMKEDANSYIDDLLSKMQTAVKALNNNMSLANDITKQLSQNIMMQTRQHSIALITPEDITRDTDAEEVVEISTVDEQVMKLVEKLVSASNFVGDFSYTFKDYNIGSWLFSSNMKNYLLNVYIEGNDAYDIENSREEINDLLENAMNFVG